MILWDHLNYNIHLNYNMIFSVTTPGAGAVSFMIDEGTGLQDNFTLKAVEGAESLSTEITNSTTHMVCKLWYVSFSILSFVISKWAS